jgi:hypothetical protein
MLRGTVPLSMTQLSAAARATYQRGMSLLWMLIFFVIFLAILFGIDLGFIFFTKECMDESLVQCVESIMEPEEEDTRTGTVTATGVISGEYGGETRAVNVHLTFPTEGGAVTGSFDGDCEGNIKGTYAGSNGAISGKGNGSCAFIMPASGEFSGTVNESSKSVSVSGSGRAAGFSGSGSLNLGW